MPQVHADSAKPRLTEGAEVDLTIDKLAFGGKALGRVAGCVVFVNQALPGQRVRVRITNKKSKFAEAQVIQLLAQSPVYSPPFCRHFGFCGGCQWQDLDYEEQLHWKRVQVQECLRHLAGLTPGRILPPVASPHPRYYRNKMEFTFAPRGWLPAADRGRQDKSQGAWALGLHVRASRDQIFDLEECFLQSPQATAILKEVRSLCRQSGLPPYNPKNRRGFWRFLVLRESKRTSQILAHLITTHQGEAAAIDALGERLQARFPALTTLVHSRSRQKAQVARGESSRTLWGSGYIEEQLCGLRLRVSAQSFLQTNTAAAEGLYEAVSGLAELTGRETVWDLYCGAGSIALSLASRARRVVGFELVPEAVKDAYLNSRLNGLDNCHFLGGDLKERLRETWRQGSQPLPEVVITDPPRSGMHLQVVQALKELAPRRIIYVSCNPATLARDLALLGDRYEILTIQPFDLFPHTAHIESVTRLERRQAAP
jgi:23S rRNA (uracil1939-C5)-methyltransferase